MFLLLLCFDDGYNNRTLIEEKLIWMWATIDPELKH